VGHDADDLAQEARLAVMRALSKLDAARGEGAAATYIRRAIQRALINLRRDSRTHGRAPRTSEGRLAGVYSIDAPSSPEDVRSLVETMPADSDTPEETASMRELVRALEERLSRYEAAQLRAVFVEGAKLARARLRGADVDARIERVRLRARAILEGLLVKSDGVEEKAEDGTMTTKKKLNVFQAKNVPDVSAEDATDCHAANEGPDAAGYEPSSEDCTVKCPDKFSCLVALVGNRAKNHLKLTLASDSEVEAVTSGEMTWEGFVKRYNERMALLDAGKPVPAALLPKGAASAPAPAVASDDTGDDDTGDDASDDEGAEQEAATAATTDDDNGNDDEEDPMAKSETTKKASAKKAPAKKAEPKKAAPKKVEPKKAEPKKAEPKKAAPKKVEPKKAAPAPAKKGTAKKAAPKIEKAPAPAKKNGKAERAPAKRSRIDPSKRVAICEGKRHLPQPRSLSTEEMSEALGRLDFGQKFDLAVGMEIVRKRRAGEQTVVRIAKDGFIWNGTTYPSISAAVMWAEQRSVSGNDFFSIVKHGCTQIQGKAVPGNVVSRGGVGVEATTGGRVAKKKAKAAPKPKAVSAKKATPKKGKPPALDAKKKGKLAALKAKGKAATAKLATPPPPAPEVTIAVEA